MTMFSIVKVVVRMLEMSMTKKIKVSEATNIQLDWLGDKVEVPDELVKEN
jgi:hypothetical protein